jgi:hypothetical protein
MTALFIIILAQKRDCVKKKIKIMFQLRKSCYKYPLCPPPAEDFSLFSAIVFLLSFMTRGSSLGDSSHEPR